MQGILQHFMVRNEQRDIKVCFNSSLIDTIVREGIADGKPLQGAVSVFYHH